MKTLKLRLVIGIILILSSAGYSQDFDNNRMNRDIKIMENILNELFRYSQTVETNEDHVIVSLGRSNSNRTKGTYLPGYGVIFQISKPLHSKIRTVQVDKTGGASNYSFFYGDEADNINNDEQKSDEINEDTITQKIKEFLRDYAVNISQLASDEKVLVIYGADSNHDRLFNMNTYFRNSPSNDEEAELISVLASKKDLVSYRSRQINEATFMNRLTVEKNENKEVADLKVLANIFKTAFTDVPNHSFRASGNVDYLYLANFGVLYSMEVRLNSGDGFRLSAPRVTINKVDNNNINSNLSINTNISINQNKLRAALFNIERDSIRMAELIEKREEFEANTKEAFNKLKEDIKQYLVDYGRTLRSLNNDQHIWLNVSISQNWANMDVPKMLEFQIQKFVLEQFDKGDISRERVLNQIQVSDH